MKYFSDKIIDANELKQNYRALSSVSKKKICAVVKADAYGHGIKTVCKILDDCDFFAVQNVVEGIQVRRVNKTAIVLVLGYCSNYKLAAKHNISVCVDNVNQVYELKKLNQKFKVHIKVNTGMNRLGVKTLQEFEKILVEIKNSSNIILEGMFTHCFCTNNEKITKKQQKTFKKYTKLLNFYNFSPILHIGGSGMIKYKCQNFDYIRCGISLYGYESQYTKPVMKIVSKVIKITNIKKSECVGYDCAFVAQREMSVALIPLGYADGIPRDIFEKLFVLWNGKQLKCVGKICMDMFMVDCTGLDIMCGDKIAVFFDANDWAKQLNVSKYEILTNLIKARTNTKIVNMS